MAINRGLMPVTHFIVQPAYTLIFRYTKQRSDQPGALGRRSIFEAGLAMVAIVLGIGEGGTIVASEAGSGHALVSYCAAILMYYCHKTSKADHLIKPLGYSEGGYQSS